MANHKCRNATLKLPLSERRIELLMKYGLRIKCNTRNPAYQAVFNLRYKSKYNDSIYNSRRNSSRPQRRARSIAVELDELFDEAGIKLSRPQNATYYPRSNQTEYQTIHRAIPKTY